MLRCLVSMNGFKLPQGGGGVRARSAEAELEQVLIFPCVCRAQKLYLVPPGQPQLNSGRSPTELVGG